jgi:signal transduction histidine kinase
MSADASTMQSIERRAPGTPVVRMAVVTIVYLAIAALAAVYPLISPLWAGEPTALGQGIEAVAGAAWLVTLLITMARQPSGSLWKLIFAFMVSDRLYALTFIPDSLVWSVARVLELVEVPVFIHLVLAFPSGRLRDRFDRAVVGFAYVFVIGSTVLGQLFWGAAFACDPDCVRNVFAIWPDPDLHDLVGQGQILIAVTVLYPLVLVGLWRHWRDASPAARRSLMPLIIAIPLTVVLASIDRLAILFQIRAAVEFSATPAAEVLRNLVPVILPVGLLVGIMQVRLRRGRIADLVVELRHGVPTGRLRDVLARTLDDPSLQLAFETPSGNAFVDETGQPIELVSAGPSRAMTRLENDGRLVAVLMYDPAIEREDPGLVEAAGDAAQLALENERLAAEVRAQLAEVRASRARIVEATDAERRRVERDLHDGAQQRLVALAMRLQLARNGAVGASAVLDDATAELQAAIGEVRDLARGLHPPILTEAGLAAAVEGLAERAPLPVTVDISDRRYPAAIEATAYFVVAEALTNAARYAQANEVQVTVDEHPDRLTLTVTDDGGGGADPEGGTGLRGLADRVAAAGGELIIASSPGAGTSIRAELPLNS